MKKTGVLLILLSIWALTSASAQQPKASMAQPRAIDVAKMPTESDMYCSGFIAEKPVAKTSFIGAGWDTPNQSLTSDRDVVYLTGGSYQTGAKYQIIRAIRDDDEFEYVKDQKKTVAKTGVPYAELGRVRVIDVQKNIGIAVVEFSCDGFQPGDLAVPWVEKQVPTFKAQLPFNRLAPPNGKLTGRVIMAKDFDNVLGNKHKVYLDIGSSKGVKAGDYFRVTRTYEDLLSTPAYSLLMNAQKVTDPNQKNPPELTTQQIKAQMPRRSLGELVVLYTTPVSSTAMITSSVEAMQIGDGVEMLEEPPPPPPPPPPAVMNPPSISCSAEPASVRAGESSTVRCTGTSPDNRPLTYTFVSDAGTLSPRENVASIDTKGTTPGVVSVMTTATDDRNLSASATTRITIEAPLPPAQASRLGEFAFRPNSAYVDNTAKAALDGVALRLQREANSSVLFVGYSALAEAARLGTARANNAKTYMTKDKGIDAARIEVRDGGKGGRRVEIWFIPAGAAMPDVKPITAPEAPAKKPAKPSAAAKKSAAPAKPGTKAPAPK